MDATTNNKTPRKAVLMTVCRVCGDDLKFGKKKQVFSLDLHPNLKTTFDIVKLPVASEDDTPPSICASCFQILNKYSRAKDLAEGIKNTIHEKCKQRFDRFKRCATTSTTPTHHRKRRVRSTFVSVVFCPYLQCFQ